MRLLLISKRLDRRLFLMMLVVSPVLEVGGVFDVDELALFMRGLIGITKRCTCGKWRNQSSGLMFFRTDSAVRSAELEDPMDDGSASETSTPSSSSGLAPRELAHGLVFS